MMMKSSWRNLRSDKESYAAALKRAFLHLGACFGTNVPNAHSRVGPRLFYLDQMSQMQNWREVSLSLLHRYQISESRIASALERLTLESGVPGGSSANSARVKCTIRSSRFPR